MGVMNKNFIPLSTPSLKGGNEWKYVKENVQEKTLYVVPADQAENDGNYIYAKYYPNGKLKSKIFAYDFEQAHFFI